MKKGNCTKCLFGIKKFFIEYIPWMTLLWFLIIIFVIAQIIIIYNPHFMHPFVHLFKSNIEMEYTWIYYLASCFFTFLVVFVAWLQLKSINNKIKDEFLLKIDERWESTELSAAKKILHTLELEHNKDYTKIGQEIIRMSESKDQNDIDNFMSIEKLLGFIETIGYLHNKGGSSLDSKDIKKLFGEAIMDYYKIFMLYIKKNQDENKNIYKEFSEMHEALKEE